MPDITWYPFDTLLGSLVIAVRENGEIAGIYFGGSGLSLPAETRIKTDTVCAVAAQIDEYASGKRTQFELPYVIRGREFESSVWRELAKIPYGETRTYKQIAESAGSPRAYRAVGTACHNNPLPIIVPCHRVIGSNGSLTGYAGGIEFKKRLLELEAKVKNK
ncbi:hypothetical protein FACS1894105_00190 [Clostridia bacterium]|nr:hypothetical protein FACS1894105_00190 [Clostridia bacterium]